MIATTDISDTPKRRYRWLKFSLRTMLLLVVVMGVWLGLKVNAARRQRDAIAATEELGGKIFYEHEISVKQRPPGPDWLRRMLGDEYHGA